MNKIWIYFSISILFIACTEDNKLCIDKSVVDNSLQCDTIYQPVCGCNNETYYNACEAEYMNGIKQWTNGQCAHKCSYIDTLTVFSINEQCTILTDFTTFYEVSYEPENFIWEKGQSYFVNYFTANTAPKCIQSAENINITCVKPYIPNCHPIIETQGADNFLPNDTLHIDSIALFDPCLTVYYRYLGGCNEPRLDLYHLNDSSTNFSTRLQLRYDNGEGPCDEFINDSCSFDLSSIQIECTNQINIQLDANGDADFYEEFSYEYE